MQSTKLALILLTTAAAINLTACKTDAPDHTPYLMPKEAQSCLSKIMCPKYKLVDPKNLTYETDGYAPCSDIVGGMGLPPGQFQAVAAWGRLEVKRCNSSAVESQEDQAQ